jgi:hypothetical protein
MHEKRIAAQWHRISSRVLQDLQHRTTIRTAPEETNLAANIHPHDATAAEFIRTYMSKSFPGARLARREELERESTVMTRASLRTVPAKSSNIAHGKDIYLRCFEDFYGYRGMDPRVYYLSPWEFTMFLDSGAFAAAAATREERRGLGWE